MIATTAIIAMVGVCVVCALLGAVFFWLDHNAKHGLKIKENKLSPKWVIGAIVAGLAVSGFALYRLKDGEMEWNDILATYGLIMGIASVFVAKIFNEGIGAFAKYAKQKTVEVVEAVDDFSEIKAMLEAEKAEMAEVKKKLGL